MDKKFVKSDMFNYNKYPDKPDKPRLNPNPPKDRIRKPFNQFVEKSDSFDLRKYF